jgi:hypothetical protein
VRYELSYTSSITVYIKWKYASMPFNFDISDCKRCDGTREIVQDGML